MLGYIPSPSTNGFTLGPLRLHAYGFLIVLGVFAAVWLADRRWRAWGGDPGTFSNIAVWAVPAGLIGARLYSVVTDYELYTHNPAGALEIWKGGLGIWGGIAGGALGAWLYVRRHHLDWAAIADCVAPALPLAQAVGRWGNYFNQELFGRPTTLPWGLKIEPSIVANLFSNINRPVPPAYLHAAAFQPTFLYECIWDLACVVLVLWAEKHIRLRRGYLFWVYVALYTFGRFFTEYLRIDFAHKILGLRLNDWTSILVFVLAMFVVLRWGLARRNEAGDTASVDEADPARERPRVAVAAGGPGPATVAGGETLDDEDIGPVIGNRVGSAGSEDEEMAGPSGRDSPAPEPIPPVPADPSTEAAPAVTEAHTPTLAQAPEPVAPAIAETPPVPAAAPVEEQGSSMTTPEPAASPPAPDPAPEPSEEGPTGLS